MGKKKQVWKSLAVLTINVPDDALVLSPWATTISDPVLSAQTSSWSLAAALNVSPAAINTWKFSKERLRNYKQINNWAQDDSFSWWSINNNVVSRTTNTHPKKNNNITFLYNIICYYLVNSHRSSCDCNNTGISTKPLVRYFLSSEKHQFTMFKMCKIKIPVGAFENV